MLSATAVALVLAALSSACRSDNASASVAAAEVDCPLGGRPQPEGQTLEINTDMRAVRAYGWKHEDVFIGAFLSDDLHVCASFIGDVFPHQAALRSSLRRPEQLRLYSATLDEVRQKIENEAQRHGVVWNGISIDEADQVVVVTVETPITAARLRLLYPSAPLRVEIGAPIFIGGGSATGGAAR